MQVDADGHSALGDVYRAAVDCDGLHSDAGGMSGFALVVSTRSSRDFSEGSYEGIQSESNDNWWQ